MMQTSANRNNSTDNLLAAERMVKKLSELVQLSEDWVIKELVATMGASIEDSFPSEKTIQHLARMVLLISFEEDTPECWEAEEVRVDVVRINAIEGAVKWVSHVGMTRITNYAVSLV